VALHSMSRMARKGMGYTSMDDARLRDAEFEIDTEHEVGRLHELLRQTLDGRAPLDRAGALCGIHEAIQCAWWLFGEREHPDERHEAPRHACLGLCNAEHSEPTLFGLVAALADSWVEVLSWSAEAPERHPPAAVLDLLAGWTGLRHRLASAGLSALAEELSGLHAATLGGVSHQTLKTGGMHLCAKHSKTGACIFLPKAATRVLQRLVGNV
jgi:hypothetical protein